MPDIEVDRDDRKAERALQARAVRLLAAREHTTFELRRKLARNCGDDEAAVERVVARLGEANLVSDARFVEEFIRARIERGHGPVRIRADLRGRGVDDELIDGALTLPATFWAQRMSQVRMRKFGKSLPTERTEWGRQARFLAQRGYPADIIYQVLNADFD